MADWSPQTTPGDISNFRETSETLAKRRARRLKISAVILVIIVLAGISARPLYHAFRDFRIGRNLEEARIASRLEDWPTTRDRARSVLLARPMDFEAFRLWSQALAKLGEPLAFAANVQLFVNPHASREDKLEALQILALQAPQAIALGAYGSLPAELRNQASFRAAMVPLLLQRGEVQIAEKELREVMGDSDPPPVKLELLRILCAGPTPDRIKEARQIFSGLINGHSPSALAALLILGEVKDGTAVGEPLPDLRRWIAGQPDAETLHRLLALNPTIEASPNQADAIFDSAIRTYLPTDPGILGTWLIRNGRVEKAVEILKAPAETRADAYVAYLNGLLHLNRTSDLEAALSKPPNSADLVEVYIIRAAVAAKRGDKISASAFWTKALDQAGFDTKHNRFVEIANAAKSYGAQGAMEDAWVAAVRMGWGPLPLYRDLVPLISSLGTEGRTEDLLAVCRSLERFEPEEPDLVNNVQYLGLIHGVFQPDPVSKRLRKLVEDHPEMRDVDSARMLAEMMAGRPQDALDLLPELRKAGRVSPMMIMALEGTAKVMIGETDAGRELLLGVHWNLFMRQERVAFRDLLVKLKIAGLPLPDLESGTSDADLQETPGWRKSVEKAEKARAGQVLPALPSPKIPGAEIRPKQ